MATSNNDRVSSQRLLDTLKGLQASRHLGSEPEVVTETVEYPAVVSPAAGTYNDITAFQQEMGSKQVNENRLPIKIYTTPSNPYVDPVFPLTINEPSGDYVEADKKVTWNGSYGYANAEIVDKNTYTGYLVLNSAGMWVGYHIENGTPDNNQYQWEMPEKTVTSTTKTKHPIKQDYVPNADWNQNDPDGEGYVQGRTHWVEVSETECKVTILAAQLMGALSYGYATEIGDLTGFDYPDGEYKPNRIGKTQTIEGATIAYLGEDANGVPLTISTMEEFEQVLQNTAIGIMLLSQEGQAFCYIAYPEAKANDVCTYYVIKERVNKLDRKFYDYTPPVDLTPYQKRIDLNNKDIDYNGIGTNFPFISTGEFAITTTNNVIHDLTVGNSNELLQLHHLWYEENLYSNKLKATALFWLIANCCTEIKDEQANVYTVNSIEKWSVNAGYHTATLKTNDGEFTLEVQGSSCRFAPPSNVKGNTFTLTVDYYITGDMLSKGSLINSSLFNANNKVSLLANGVLMVRNNIRGEITIPKNTLGVRDTFIGTIVSNTVIDSNGDLWHAEGVYSETDLTIKFAKKQDNVWRYGIPDSPTVFMFAEITSGA